MENNNRRLGRKKFEFPENIESTYGVLLGLSLKEIGMYIAPIVLGGIILLFIPPVSVKSVLIKLFIVVLLTTAVIAILTASPVKHRNNIRLVKHLKMKRQYGKRQKIYFISKRK